MSLQGKQRRLHRAVRVLAGRQRSLDTGASQATLAGLYKDLTERMWLALQEVKARAVATRDEETGHAFHGNQWTGGLGAKPKTHSQKTSKAAVHELLSSGHPFTKAELMDIAGIKTEKLFSDYMAMLKNPKYAGPKGALSIQAKDGHYFVALPNGQPAPPLEKATKGATLFTEEKAQKIEQMAADILADIKAAKEPTPAEKAVAAPAPSPAPVASASEPYGAAVAALSGAHPGSLPKAEADKHYEQAMAAANVMMAMGVKKSDVAGGHEAVLKWKKQKAAAMAAWAQAVHGHAHAPKAQALFKADEHLATQIAQGTPLSEAIAQWKTNTSNEKAGLFPAAKAAPAGITPPGEDKPVHPGPTPGTAAWAKQQAALAAAPHKPDMGHAAPVAPIDYTTLVPETHEPVGPHDFATESGAWSKGLSHAKSSLVNESASSAQDNKKTVEHRLRERLKDKPNFQALVKRLGLAKDGHGSLESRLISAWAGSSGDTHDISVALQMAVRDAFSIPDSHIEKAALNSLNVHGHDVDKLTKAGIFSLNQNITPLQSHEVQTARAALQEFVQAQYAETQDLLKKLGHDHMYLARGMKEKVGHLNAHGAANLKLQPASSFSTQYSTANQFSGGYGTVFLTKVPREQILSCYLTGFGCTGEHEVVVLAHSKMKAYTVPSGLGQQSAASKVHNDVHGLKKAHEAAMKKAGIDVPKQEPLAPKKKPAQTQNQKAVQAASQEFIKSALTQGPADHKAALKKAVINAKSKALKAKQAAEKKFPGNPEKAAHAAKAAEEAKQAVAALQAFMKGGKP